MMDLDQQRAHNRTMNPEGPRPQKKITGPLANAMQMLDEQLDDVKHMNQLALMSKVVTIRDKQLEENKILEMEYREEQKRLDQMMEIERLKAIQAEQDREYRRKEA